MAKFLWTAFFTEHPWWLLLNNMSIQYTITRFTQGLLQLLFTFFDWKTPKWAYHRLQFFISYWERFLKLTKFIKQFFLSLLNLFLLLSTFSVFLHDYFFGWFAFKSRFNRFSVLVNYIMWSYNLFSVSSCFPRFTWSRFFWVHVQGLGLAFRSNPFLVGIFSYVDDEKWENKAKVHKVHKIHHYTIIK